MAQVVASIACVWLQNVKLLGYAVVGVHPHIRINIKDMKDSESLVYQLGVSAQCISRSMQLSYITMQ